MLTTFPKVMLRIYEHALLCHVLDVLVEGSLLDGSSWFWEAYNKVWKHQLLYQSNSGGGVNKDLKVAVHEKRSETGSARLQVEQGSREDLTALKAMWACSHPEVCDYAAQWAPGSGRDGGSNADSVCWQVLGLCSMLWEILGPAERSMLLFISFPCMHIVKHSLFVQVYSSS
jgi:hypothetical protein